MSLKYSLMEMKYPLRPDESAKVYARSQIREVIDINRVAAEISYNTSLSDGDVLGVLRGLVHSLKGHLADSDLVDLAEFGSLQYQVSSRGADTGEGFTPEHICDIRLQFRPGALLKAKKDKLSL